MNKEIMDTETMERICKWFNVYMDIFFYHAEMENGRIKITDLDDTSVEPAYYTNLYDILDRFYDLLFECEGIGYGESFEDYEDRLVKEIQNMTEKDLKSDEPLILTSNLCKIRELRTITEFKEYWDGGMTEEELKAEINEVNDLLAPVCISARIDYNGDGNARSIKLDDWEGTCAFDIDEDNLLCTAEDVMQRCKTFFDNVYLDGETCCDCGYNFKTYGEAEEEARERGYIREADEIHKLRRYYA